MLSHRFHLPLAAALFLSTLASANSTNVTTAYVHPGAGNTASYAVHFSTVGGKTSPSIFVAYTSYPTTPAIENPGTGAAVSGRVMNGGRITAAATGFIFLARMYEPSCCETRARNWVSSSRGPGSKPGLSTPEPGTLMLLSTGLMGIAGIVRRKLRRG